MDRNGSYYEDIFEKDNKKEVNDRLKPKKIAVAGTGYVGLSIATLLSQHNSVKAVDIIPEKVELINNKKSPIHLYATDGIQIDQKEQTITAITNAKATQEQITIKADKLILHYTDNKKERIDQIEAIGHVVADNKKQTIQGEKGLYNPKTNIIQMNQNVVLNQNGNFMKGDQATLNLATGKSDLTASGRITGQILPNQIKGE